MGGSTVRHHYPRPPCPLHLPTAVTSSSSSSSRVGAVPTSDCLPQLSLAAHLLHHQPMVTCHLSSHSHMVLLRGLVCRQQRQEEEEAVTTRPVSSYRSISSNMASRLHPNKVRPMLWHHGQLCALQQSPTCVHCSSLQLVCTAGTWSGQSDSCAGCSSVRVGGWSDGQMVGLSDGQGLQ